RDPAAAAERAAMLSSEFILDDQTHHVHDTFSWKGILFLREYASGKNPEGKAWNPALASEPSDLDAYKFDKYVRDIFLDSDTKIDSWKGYTVGDPLAGGSKYPWMLDDEKLAYPAYEKARKYGIRNICIHKGLMPSDYQTSFANWRYASVDDLGKAAKDWPDLNF